MSAEIITFGCRLNAYESEVIRSHAAALENTVIVNTCAVTAEAERQARQAIRRIVRTRPGTQVIATGCAVQLNPARWSALPGVSRVVGNAEKLRAETWAADTSVGRRDLTVLREEPPQLITEFGGRARAFVQIQQGCDHRCTFCTIPFARGPSRSLSLARIIEQTQLLVARGFQEVVLTGVDLTSYGLDLPDQPRLGQMVRRLLAEVPELPRLRLSSLDPAEIDEDLWRVIAEEPRLMPHVHLSLQAGSDLILKRMKRRHSTATAKEAITRARLLRPGIAIGADLIAGFPTETEALFRETFEFVQEMELPYLHVFPFSSRPGTPAARMPQVPPSERDRRAALLRELGEAARKRFFSAHIGRRVEILLESPERGHTEHFCPVSLSSPRAAGTLVSALVSRADAKGLTAEAS
ncbi:MAG: tRNA (N(6)-L-threonylcarbamoyladenosine(37)-C(2))-methylthiotransferase MtaB [Acidobacteriia bacterium]|nr:tRNA (N(6)-L-threonylcarbamoyladenosine(37)-C(2))-methylthiotransferase MtaB [Methyloceanibacter sp.]MBX5471271.1 tRNA (N(6)-L-threonylcarbamoyladenosine(37)-C(2))-methylthiotransferase MtaB [Acetobacteraceae bacterium]MCL6490204.1 tRNA (N(6)-L-threonylcarbamoyladenosine(37)-C(2))-methylthiotransferase MtaB [Terriglobia bacterium]